MKANEKFAVILSSAWCAAKTQIYLFPEPKKYASIGRESILLAITLPLIFGCFFKRCSRIFSLPAASAASKNSPSMQNPISHLKKIYSCF